MEKKEKLPRRAARSAQEGREPASSRSGLTVVLKGNRLRSNCDSATFDLNNLRVRTAQRTDTISWDDIDCLII